MFKLKFYRVEREKFAKEAEKTLTTEETIKLCKKLARHFKIELQDIRFNKRTRGSAVLFSATVCFPKQPTLLVVCHELAHLYCWQNFHDVRHNKRLLRTIGRFIRYVNAKGYVSEEVHIPFRPEFREAMLNGTKVITSRAKPYGKKGDTFRAFGAEYLIDSVEKKPFEWVLEQWRAEGCASKEDFIKIWKRMYPTREFKPDDMLYIHRFHKKCEGEGVRVGFGKPYATPTHINLDDSLSSPYGNS